MGKESFIEKTARWGGAVASAVAPAFDSKIGLGAIFGTQASDLAPQENIPGMVYELDHLSGSDLIDSGSHEADQSDLLGPMWPSLAIKSKDYEQPEFDDTGRNGDTGSDDPPENSKGQLASPAKQDDGVCSPDEVRVYLDGVNDANEGVMRRLYCPDENGIGGVPPETSLPVTSTGASCGNMTAGELCTALGQVAAEMEPPVFTPDQQTTEEDKSPLGAVKVGAIMSVAGLLAGALAYAKNRFGGRRKTYLPPSDEMGEKIRQERIRAAQPIQEQHLHVFGPHVFVIQDVVTGEVLDTVEGPIDMGRSALLSAQGILHQIAARDKVENWAKEKYGPNAVVNHWGLQ